MTRESGTKLATAAVSLLDPKDRIDECVDWVRWRFRGVVLNLALMGFGRCRVICGRRTFEEQLRLYGMGRSKEELRIGGYDSSYADGEKGVVSWIRPECSMHVRGRAIDVDFSEYGVEDLAPVGGMARAMGVTWGGEWSVRDYAHFEL